MIAETIFYITGSIFFGLSILLLAIFIVYTFKILQKIVAIESEVKNAITEVKIKIAAFSVGITGAIALLEKLVEMKNKRNRNKEDSSSEDDKNDEEKPAKKVRIRKIFGVGE